MNVAAWRHTHCGQTIVSAVAYYMAGSNTFLTTSTFASEHFTTFLKIHLNKVLYNAIVWLWIYNYIYCVTYNYKLEPWKLIINKLGCTCSILLF